MIRCPRCSEPLIRRRAAAVELDGCSCCGGSFFDKGELSALAAEPARLAEVDRLFSPAQAALAPKATGLCPRCGTGLARFEQAGLAGIELDACKTCRGIWLDHGEASEIARRRGWSAEPAPVAPAPKPEPVPARSPPWWAEGRAAVWIVGGMVLLFLGLGSSFVQWRRVQLWPHAQAIVERSYSYGYRGRRTVRVSYVFQAEGRRVVGKTSFALMPYSIVEQWLSPPSTELAYDPEKSESVIPAGAPGWSLVASLVAAALCGFMASRFRPS